MGYDDSSDEWTDEKERNKSKSKKLPRSWRTKFPWLVLLKDKEKKCSVCDVFISGGIGDLKKHDACSTHSHMKELEEQQHIVSTSSATAAATTTCVTVHNMPGPAKDQPTEFVLQGQLKVEKNDEELNISSTGQDLNTTQNTDGELLSVLIKYNMGSYFPLLEEHNVNMSCLKYIKEDDIKDIFGKDIGGRIQFRALIEQLRVTKNYRPNTSNVCVSMSESTACANKISLSSTTSFSNESFNDNCETSSNSQQPSLIITMPDINHYSFLENDISQNCEPPATGEKTSQNITCANKRSLPATVSPAMKKFKNNSGMCLESSSKCNLDKFLESPVGLKMKQKYEQNNCLSKDNRNCLASYCIEEHLKNNIPITVSMFEGFARKICSKFKNESTECYFIKLPKMRPQGILWSRYRSLLVSYRKSGIFTKQVKYHKKKTHDSNKETKHQSQCDEKDLLQTKDTTWQLVELNWKKSYDTRRADILSNSTSNILLEWPMFKNSDGYELVNIDFDKLYPGKSNNLFKKWNAVEGKLIKTCKEFLQFPEAITLVNNVSSDPELRCFDIFQILQAVVEPISQKTCSENMWKLSVNDSWNAVSFAINAHTPEDIPIILSGRKHFCIAQKKALQPFLIIIRGDSENVVQFASVADGITYMFNNFLQAFDACFKMYHVLNFDYPVENKRFWHFVQSFFYDIKSINETFLEFQSLIELFKI